MTLRALALSRGMQSSGTSGTWRSTKFFTTGIAARPQSLCHQEARVLALTQPGELEALSGRWMDALTGKYPNRATALALAAGSGLRQLLSSEEDMDQTTLTCNLGLLSSMEVTRDMLAEVIEPLEEAARALIQAVICR